MAPRRLDWSHRVTQRVNALSKGGCWRVSLKSDWGPLTNFARRAPSRVILWLLALPAPTGFDPAFAIPRMRWSKPSVAAIFKSIAPANQVSHRTILDPCSGQLTVPSSTGPRFDGSTHVVPDFAQTSHDQHDRLLTFSI